MTGKGTRACEGAKAVLLCLSLIPFLLTHLIAEGAMPQSSPAGFTVVLCTGDGPLEIEIGPDGTPHPVAPDSQHHTPCHWAAGTLVFLGLHAPSLLTVAPVEIAAATVASAELEAHRTALRLPPPRGPPLQI